MEDKDKIIEVEQNKNIDENKMVNNSDLKETIHSIITVIAFIVAFLVAAGSGCIRCTWCGNDDNRLIIYASGTAENGVEYESFVGPASCLGFGINSKCWPTECMHIKRNEPGGGRLTGCVTYYNETGCIAKSGVKSEGSYAYDATCLGISCAGDKYIETNAETTKAKEQDSILGIGCGGKSPTEPRGYNSLMPRQFTHGCWEGK